MTGSFSSVRDLGRSNPRRCGIVRSACECLLQLSVTTAQSRAWPVTKPIPESSWKERQEVAVKLAPNKDDPPHDNHPPYRPRLLRSPAFAQPGARAGRLRSGQDGQGRRHEEGFDVQ